MTTKKVLSSPTFEIALIEPEIPNNTGNIGRTAVATNSRLHIVHPIGFDMDSSARKRAGLDYWQYLDYQEHESWNSYLSSTQPARAWLFSTKGTRVHWEADFAPGDHLIFGKESAGISPEARLEFEAQYGADSILRVPMHPNSGVRSLNLANVVALATFEGLRQIEVLNSKT